MQNAKRFVFHYAVHHYGMLQCLRYPLYHQCYLLHKTYNILKHLGVSNINRVKGIEKQQLDAFFREQPIGKKHEKIELGI